MSEDRMAEARAVCLWASCVVRPPLSPREVVVSSPDSVMLRTGAWSAQHYRYTPRARTASRVKEDDKNKNNNKKQKQTNKQTNNQREALRMGIEHLTVLFPTEVSAFDFQV